MTTEELLTFMRGHPLAVEASVSATGAPQAAVVGIVVTDDFEVFFDAFGKSRKVENLRRNSKIAFVIGGTTAGDERTVQYEGLADQPNGAELQRLNGVVLRVVSRRAPAARMAGYHLFPRAAGLDSIHRFQPGPA
jgi:hypothetical protein